MGCWNATRISNQASPGQTDASETEWVAGNDLPDYPTPLLVADATGISKWTVSIPHQWTFPLPPRYYKDICAHGSALRDDLSSHAERARGSNWWRPASHHDAKDQTYLDVADAEASGALPQSPENDTADTCPSSMTVVLEAGDASFGQSLMLLWLSYGLAKQEGRAFFIDDSRWAWGRYASYFMPAPKSNCSVPPHQIVPCIPSARHLLVSSATSPWTFGAGFRSDLQRLHKRGKQSQRAIFDLIRAGYQDLFHLAGEDSLYAAARIAKLKDEASQHNGAFIGMQIRRGDMHPFEFQYSKDYLPLERYADGAHSLLQSHLSRTSGRAIDPSSPSIVNSSLALASDDPDIIHDPDLWHAALPLTILPAQERIQLATKATLDKNVPRTSLREPGSAYIKHVDENSGWEGGFYSALFFSLGGGSAPTEELTPPQIPEQASRLRALVGRAYLLDLAVLGASDGVVCAVSSATCRALGVMMGWSGLKEERWVNVDGRRGWSWDGRGP